MFNTHKYMNTKSMFIKKTYLKGKFVGLTDNK